MNETIVELGNQWSESLDNYESAREIGKKLIPLLEQAGATDKSKGVDIGKWRIWVEIIGNNKYVNRDYVLGK